MGSKELIREIYRKGKVFIPAAFGDKTINISVEKGALVRQVKNMTGDIPITAARGEDGHLYLS